MFQGDERNKMVSKGGAIIWLGFPITKLGEVKLPFVTSQWATFAKGACQQKSLFFLKKKNLFLIENTVKVSCA